MLVPCFAGALAAALLFPRLGDPLEPSAIGIRPLEVGSAVSLPHGLAAHPGSEPGTGEVRIPADPGSAELESTGGEEGPLRLGLEAGSRGNPGDSPIVEDKKEDFPLTGSITLGANRSFGNTELTTVSMTARATYEVSESDRLNGGFDWYYSEEKDQTTGVTSLNQRRVRGFSQWDHFFSKKAYAYLRLDAQGDAKQDLALRFLSSAGGGYQFRDDDHVKWSGEMGLTHTNEDFGGRAPEQSVSLRLATKYARKVSGTVKTSLTLEWLPSLENQDDQLLFGANEWNFNLGEGMAATARWEFDYDNTPGTGRDRLDHRVILGLGISF